MSPTARSEPFLDGGTSETSQVLRNFQQSQSDDSSDFQQMPSDPEATFGRRQYDPMLASLQIQRNFLPENLPGYVSENITEDGGPIVLDRTLISEVVSAEMSVFFQEFVEQKLRKVYSLKESEEAVHPKKLDDQDNVQHDAEIVSEKTPSSAATDEKANQGTDRVMPADFYETVELSCPWLFGGFTHNSPVRMKCYQMYHSIEWSTLFGVVAFFYAIYLAVFPEVVLQFVASNTQHSGNRKGFEWTDALEFFCCGCLLVEVTIGIVAIGFISSPSCWLRCSNYHRLDFFVLLCTMAEYGLIFIGYKSPNFRALRLFRVFRTLAAMEYFEEVKLVLISLTIGFRELLTVSAIMVLFICCFSVFGIALYKTSYRRHCVVLNQTIPVCASDFTTNWTVTCDMASDLNATVSVQSFSDVVGGGYPFIDYCKIYHNTTPTDYIDSYPYDPVNGYHHTCQLRDFKKKLPVFQTCLEFQTYPFNNGFSHFDHIWGAMCVVFQIATRDGYADIFMVAWGAEPGLLGATYVFFILQTVLLTYLVYGIYSAIIIGTSIPPSSIREVTSEGAESEKKEDLNPDNNRVHPSNSAAEMQENKAEGAPILSETDSKEHNTNSDHLSENAKEVEDHTKDQEMVEWHPESEDEKETKIAQIMEAISKSILWQAVMVSATIVNSIALAADQYNAPSDWRAFCQWTYLSVNCVFLVHLGLNLQANGSIVALLRSSENKLEVLTVCLGLVGLAIGSQNLLLLSALRIYKLMAYFPTLANLLTSSIIGTPTLFRLLIFMVIVSFAFAVTSRYAIGNTMDALTNANFGSLATAWQTLFNILIQDGWSNVLFFALMAQSDLPTKIIVGCFIYTWFMLAVVVMNNLFVALIVYNFQVEKTMERMQEAGYFAQFTNFCKKGIQMINHTWNDLATRWSKKPRIRPSSVLEGSLADAQESIQGTDLKLHEAAVLHHKSSLRSRMVARNTIRSRIVESCTCEIPPEEEFVEVQERVLFLFTAKSRVRRFIGWLGRQRLYNQIVLLAILGSCFFLTILPPYDDMPKEDQMLPLPRFISDMSNTIFTFVFLADFIVKVMAQGLLFTSKAYLRESGWNVLDTVVLILGLIDAGGVFKGNIGKLAKLGRALRPIRLMMRVKAMRVILNTLIKTMGPVLYVAEFVLFNFLVFGLIGMGLFNGNLFACNDPGVQYPQGKIECSGTFVDADTSTGTIGVLFPRAWTSPPGNFDTFGSSMLLLFRFSLIGGGTVDTIDRAMDITEFDLSPVQNYSPSNFLFFFTFLLSTSLLAMNIFLGFIFDGFNLLRGATEKDKAYNRFARLVMTKAPKAVRFKHPKSTISVVLRAILSTKEFVRFSNLCVAMNFAFLASDHAGATEDFSNMLDTQNLVFYCQLLAEVIMSLVAYGPLECFSDPWRMLDLFVVSTSSLAYVVTDPTANKIAKAARLIRVVRIMKVIDAVRVILETLLACIPSLMNVLILMFLVFSMFACLLSQTFGTTKNGNMIGYYHSANFKTWINALHSCVQIVIMDEWVDLMTDATVTPPFCTPKFDNETVYGYHDVNYSWGDCGTVIAPLIFVLLKIMCEAVLVNLVVGMILDNFSFLTDELMEGEEQFEFGDSGPSTKQFNQLLAIFQRFSGGGPYISLSSVSTYMNRIPRPLGYLTEQGKTQYEQKDKWEENLVRAELNIILLNEHKQKIEASKSRWKFLNIFSETAEKKYLNAVHFRDLMHALLFWRCPNMVPDSVRLARAARDEKILEVSECLVIMRFMNHVYAEKMKVDLQRQLRARYAFVTWSRTEQYQLRRLQFKENRSVGPLYQESSVNVELTLLSLLYEDTEFHHDSLISARLKLSTQASLEYFKRRCANDIVVVKFIDPKHLEKGYAIADFTECTWSGWFMKKWAKDIFYEPGPDLEDVEEQPDEAVAWSKVDFIMQVRTRGRERSVIQYRYQGTLKDIHSFMTSEESGSESDAPGHYTIRFNLGLYEGETTVAGNSAAKLTRKSYDVVLELVGYLRSDDGNDTDGAVGFQNGDGRLKELEPALLE